MTKLFPKMFCDSKTASDFNMNRKKLSYTVSDGIEPYLKRKLLEDILKEDSFYSIQVDETPISEKRVNQFDVLVRYFSDADKQIVIHHLQSFFMGHAKAEDLLNNIKLALADLPKDRLLSFFSDGPNVMKSVKNKLNEINNNIVDIGTCTLHKVHNAFGHGVDVFDSDFETLLIDLYYFFKRSAVQSHDYSQLQVSLGIPNHVFQRHVNSRWLTLNSSVKRFIEQFEAVKAFFKKDVISRGESSRLKRIKCVLADKTVLAKAMFISNVSELFTGFLLLFQREEPLIHILYDEFVSLTKKLMGRFLKPESYLNKKGSELKSLDLNDGSIWLKYPEIGLNTQEELNKKCKDDLPKFYKAARSFYITCTQSLLKSLPLSNKFLENLKCLHPMYRLEPISSKIIRMLAAEVPNVVDPSEVSSITDEWILLQTQELDFNHIDEISEEAGCSRDSIKSMRLDHYWQKIFDMKDSFGNPKFKILTKLVKALLSLAHGNAECERGFSLNKNLLDNRSSLSIESINGLRQMKSHIKRIGGLENLKIEKEILQSVKDAGQKYRQRIQTSQNIQKRKLELDEEEKKSDDLKKEGEMLAQQIQSSQIMLSKAEEIIAKGLKKKDLSEIEMGQVLLKEAKTNIEKYIKLQDENRKLQLSCASKKTK